MQITPVLLALAWLLPMNILILIFNVVPAYPLDGGRMARAAIWKVTDDKLRGTRSAARLGEGFAILLGGFGLYIPLQSSSFVGLWLILLAFMIWQSARMALNGTAAASRVHGVLVADIMDHEPVVVRGTSTVEQALDESFLRYQSEWLPVVDGDGRFIGIARRDRAEELVHRRRGQCHRRLDPRAGDWPPDDPREPSAHRCADARGARTPRSDHRHRRGRHAHRRGHDRPGPPGAADGAGAAGVAITPLSGWLPQFGLVAQRHGGAYEDGPRSTARSRAC